MTCPRSRSQHTAESGLEYRQSSSEWLEGQVLGAFGYEIGVFRHAGNPRGTEKLLGMPRPAGSKENWSSVAPWNGVLGAFICRRVVPLHFHRELWPGKKAVAQGHTSSPGVLTPSSVCFDAQLLSWAMVHTSPTTPSRDPSTKDYPSSLLPPQDRVCG